MATTGDGIVILSTTGYAAEVASICAALDYRVAAIVGTGSALDAAKVLGINAVPWTGAVADLMPGPVAVALGGGAERNAVRAELAMVGRRTVTLVHPEATVGLAVEFADGCIVSPGARITANLVVGAGTLIHTGAILSHDDRIGRDVTISPAVTICGGVTVEDEAWIAAGATILPGLTVGSTATVGAGAVVTKDVASGSTVAGVPAKLL